MDVEFSEKGVSGVYGYNDKESTVTGWEHFTKGVGGDVAIRLGHAQGVMSLDHNTVSMEEPLRIGRFIGVWTRKPSFLDPLVEKYWDYFFQDKVLEVSGLSDNNISVMERTTGPVGRSEKYAGFYKENNGTFTLKVPEVDGSPVRKILKYLISGISDPVTGAAHFHGKANTRFSKINYGGDYLFILLGPTLRPDDIVFACQWFNAFPNIDLLGHLNSGTIGEAGDAGQTFDVEFNGSYVQNDTINKVAQIVTEAVGLYKLTREDVILPDYMYKKYLAKDEETLKQFGVDMDTALNRASEAGSEAAASVLANKDTILNNTTVDINPVSEPTTANTFNIGGQ